MTKRQAKHNAYIWAATVLQSSLEAADSESYAPSGSQEDDHKTAKAIQEISDELYRRWQRGESKCPTQ